MLGKHSRALAVALASCAGVIMVSAGHAQRVENWPQTPAPSEAAPVDDNQYLAPPEWFTVTPEGPLHPDDPRNRNRRRTQSEGSGTQQGETAPPASPQRARPARAIAPAESGETGGASVRTPQTSSEHRDYLATYPDVPPLPARNALAAPPPVQEAKTDTDPEIAAQTKSLLILAFTGTLPTDPGASAIRSLIASDGLAGVLIRRENAVTGSQLAELLKALRQADKTGRLMVVAAESGGPESYITFTRANLPWPSQRELGSRNDPHFAHLTYQHLAASLAQFGISVNLGPALAASADGAAHASFGDDARHVAAFARTFALGHADANIRAVPTLSAGSPGAKTEDALGILAGDGALALASLTGGESRGPDGWTLPAHIASKVSVRFCGPFPGGETIGEDVVAALNGGCHFLIVDGGAQSVQQRDRVVTAVGHAVSEGRLSGEVLDEAAQRAAEFRGEARSVTNQGRAASR